MTTIDSVPRDLMRARSIRVSNISKSYGGVPALTDVSIDIVGGSVHSFIGENGAGKSTLGKIISGVTTPDSGTISLDDEVVVLRSPREGLKHGIATIAQELAIVPSLSVIDNIFLGSMSASRVFLDRAKLRHRFDDLCERVGFSLPGGTLAGGLTLADQQKVEIMRGLALSASTLVMDEPTAALSAHEAARLRALMRSLAEAGTTIILISHFLDEVLEVSDNITSLRDGHVVRSGPASAANKNSLIEDMLGRPLSAAYPDKQLTSSDAPVVLEVRNLTAPGVKDCSFSVRAGEIVGIAGLVGAGRSELCRAIFRDTKMSGGSVVINGQTLKGRLPHHSIRRGLSFIPESRKDMGLMLDRSLKENISLTHLSLLQRLGWILGHREEKSVTGMMDSTQVRGAASKMPVRSLSGGNQQKVLFARSLFKRPAVLIADEPTRGVDVGSKRAIYDLLVAQAREGLGVVVVSSELEEVIGLSHRIIVMRAGQIVAEFSGDHIDQQEVLVAAFAANDHEETQAL